MSDRNSWCTPQWLTDLFPEVDLDPCSNARSTVRARRSYCLDRGEDGLVLPWFGMVYVNGPFSNLLPWAKKLRHHRLEITAAAFLVNADHSTEWWQTLRLPLRFDFDKRIQFSPPEGITPSTNSKPQTLLCDLAFFQRCDERIYEHGTLWRLV